MLVKELLQLVAELHYLNVREGDAKEELLNLINEEEIISILVLGVSTQSSGPGPLVTHITSRGASTCRVPVTLVPDVMTDEAIDALT